MAGSTWCLPTPGTGLPCGAPVPASRSPAFQRVPPRQFIGRYNPYSIAWADLDDDTDLDMVGASYNAELMARGFGTPSGGGVFLFTNEGGALKPDLLVSHAQALAVLLTDLDADGRRDILGRK